MNRSGFDRRLTEERREVYDLNYFENGGAERRMVAERRLADEKRLGWKRISRWSSVPVSGLQESSRQVEAEEGVPTYIIS